MENEFIAVRRNKSVLWGQVLNKINKVIQNLATLKNCKKNLKHKGNVQKDQTKATAW